MKHIIVVIDEDSNEAMYVGGELQPTDGGTVYACDIANAAGDDAIQFSHVPISGVIERWPDRFERLVLREATNDRV